MSSKHPRASIFIFPLIFLIALSACAPIQSQPTLVPVTSTATLPPTATIEWFPPTSTATPQVFQVSTSTPVYLPGLGETFVSDDFSSAAAWNTSSSDEGSVSVSRNRITIAVKAPETYIFSLRDSPLLSNFYVEIDAHPALCRGGDSYGLLFRAKSDASYRYALACNGTVRLERLKLYNHPRVIQEAIPSGDAPPGSPGDVRLGIWVADHEMRFFLNDRYQFTATDYNLEIGTLGVFAESAAENMAMTVTFSDLVVQSVDYIVPTITLTPSKTPIPTSTRSP
jgi:hypothetical protein